VSFTLPGKTCRCLESGVDQLKTCQPHLPGRVSARITNLSFPTRLAA
jgi:hypothetical protein